MYPSLTVEEVAGASGVHYPMRGALCYLPDWCAFRIKAAQCVANKELRYAIRQSVVAVLVHSYEEH